MNSPPIPQHVLQFIVESIDSVPALEALVLLREHEGRAWRDTEVAARTYVSREEARHNLEVLRDRDLLVAEGDPREYRFKPANQEDRELISQVALAYQRQLVQVTILIHGKASAPVREFARAFELKKNR